MAKKIEKTVKVIKDISYEIYQKETNKYYNKAMIDFGIILFVVALTFLIG